MAAMSATGGFASASGPGPARDLTELELPALEAALADLGAPSFHARQIYRWVYRRGVTDFARMTDLPAPLRTRLAASFAVPSPSVLRRAQSTDGTVKFLLGLQDGRTVEAVFIPDTPARTFCVSTQVGCAMQCGFCLTGRMGLTRNLTAGEIAGQVWAMAHELALAESAFNVVLMGMGEPLHNYEPTMRALRMLATECGLAVPPRRMTLSTVGVLPGLARLATEPVMPNLAVSLHAATEELRERLVPPARKYPLADLIAACRRFPLKRRERITFEYVLLAGVNDSIADARRLAALVGGMRAKVNAIPLNEAPGIPYRRPSDDRIDAFGSALAAAGVRVSIRKSRGRDIRAACGQLILEGQFTSAGQQMAARLP